MPDAMFICQACAAAMRAWTDLPHTWREKWIGTSDKDVQDRWMPIGFTLYLET